MKKCFSVLFCLSFMACFAMQESDEVVYITVPSYSETQKIFQEKGWTTDFINFTDLETLAGTQVPSSHLFLCMSLYFLDKEDKRNLLPMAHFLFNNDVEYQKYIDAFILEE